MIFFLARVLACKRAKIALATLQTLQTKCVQRPAEAPTYFQLSVQLATISIQHGQIQRTKVGIEARERKKTRPYLEKILALQEGRLDSLFVLELFVHAVIMRRCVAAWSCSQGAKVETIFQRDTLHKQQTKKVRDAGQAAHL